MSCTCIIPVYTRIEASTHKRKNTRAQSSKKDIDRLIKQNKRIKTAIHRRRVNTSWKSNHRRIVLEELVSFLDLMDDIVDILDDDDLEPYMEDDFNCGEVPDDEFYTRIRNV
jgi:hypothetical protein